MIEIARIIIAITILLILFFAYTTKGMLPKLVSFVILTSIALSMVFSGLAGLISGIDFLNFLESLFRTIADIIVYVEVGFIIFLLFFSKVKTKRMPLKVAIIIYVVLTLLLAFGIFN